MPVRLLLMFLSPRNILLTDYLQYRSCDGLKFTRCSKSCKTGDRKCRLKCYHDNYGSGLVARAQEGEVKCLQARGWDTNKYGTCTKKCKVGDRKCRADCYLKFGQIDILARAQEEEAKHLHVRGCSKKYGSCILKCDGDDRCSEKCYHDNCKIYLAARAQQGHTDVLSVGLILFLSFPRLLYLFTYHL